MKNNEDLSALNFHYPTLEFLPGNNSRLWLNISDQTEVLQQCLTHFVFAKW